MFLICHSLFCQNIYMIYADSAEKECEFLQNIVHIQNYIITFAKIISEYFGYADK